MLVEGERVGSKKNSPRIAKIKTGHSQFRHAGGGGGADGLGVSPAAADSLAYSWRPAPSRLDALSVRVGDLAAVDVQDLTGDVRR